jgi:hypothetical protein
MASKIRDRLEAAIRAADERSLSHLRASSESMAEAEKAMQPVRQAAEEISEELRSTPSIRFTINPESVCISLADSELWCTYEPQSQKFTGEESAHSWYDGERYAERYEWANAEECIDAMIRLCAQFVRMARAIGTATG